MTEKLRSFIEERIDITDKEFEYFLSLFTHQTLKRHELLHTVGKPCTYMAFVTKGCLRLYTTDNKQQEHNVQFAIENWWITDAESFYSGELSLYNIDALETSEVMLIDLPSLERAFNRVPKLERMFRLIMQGGFIGTQRRISAFLGTSAEDRYLLMINMYPNIFQRLPFRHIASYLGIMPESLSRIRRQLMNKERLKDTSVEKI